MTKAKKLLLALAALVVLLLGAGLFLGACVFTAPVYKGPKSDHFDGERFVNREPTGHESVVDVMQWLLTREQGPWPDFIDDPPGDKPPARVGKGELRVTFVNHATLLVQMDGLNILTDPHFSERASPVSFAGPKRVRPPGIRFEDLPHIDAVLVSHNHYDHLDLPTLRRLVDRDEPALFVALGNNALLLREGVAGGRDLDWWQTAQLSADVRVHSVPTRHFSARGITDRDKNLWGGFVVEGPAGNVFFAGDTGYGSHFQEVGERFGPLRLALLPIGAYLPRWFMAPVHIDPKEAVRAHQDLRAQTSVAMHFGTFPLADDGYDEPPRDLKKALEESELADTAFWVLGFGEGRAVPAVLPVP